MNLNQNLLYNNTCCHCKKKRSGFRSDWLRGKGLEIGHEQDVVPVATVLLSVWVSNGRVVCLIVCVGQ